MAALALSKLRRDGGTQPRAGIYTDTVDEYAEALTNGDVFPPVVAFYDGTAYWLTDGFHRVLGAEKAGWAEIETDIRQGTRRDAILFSVGTNASHGLPRTRQDKRRAVETLLLDDEWAKWSDREIGRRTSTHGTFVAKIRTEVSAVNSRYEERTCVRNGTEYQVDVSGIQAEAERRVAEAKAEAKAKADELAALQAKAAADKLKASQREENLVAAKTAAIADKDKYVAESTAWKVRAEKTVAEALAKADREAEAKYAADVERLKQEAAKAKADLKSSTELLEKATVEAAKKLDEAAKAKADVLLAQELGKRKDELAKLEAKAKRALEESTSAHDAKKRLDDEIKKNREALARMQSADSEGIDQAKLADKIAESMGMWMSEIALYEHGPHQLSARKFEIAAQMCEQVATAIRSFIAPRLASTEFEG